MDPKWRSRLINRPKRNDNSLEAGTGTRQYSLVVIVAFFISLTKNRYIKGVKNCSLARFNDHLWKQAVYDWTI